MGEESGGERSGKRRPSRCRVHELPAGGGHDRGWLPSTRQQATRATQTRLAGFSLTRLWMPRPLPGFGTRSRHGPGFGTRSRLSTAVSPASLLAPPTSDYTRATLSNFKQRKTDLWCHVILQVSPSPCPPFLKGYLCSTSQSRLPLLLDSSSPLQSCFCACHQVHSHLLAIKPNGNLLVSFYLPFR